MAKRSRKPKVPEFKKPKEAKRLPGLTKKSGGTPLPSLEAGGKLANLVNDEEYLRLMKSLDDDRLVKKIQSMKKTHGDATFLELVIMEFLDRKRVRYYFQYPLLGGRGVSGGQTVDFAVIQGPYATIIEAQGNYWHTVDNMEVFDAAQRAMLLASNEKVMGFPILHLVELWESKVMIPQRQMREYYMELALQGVEVGK
jgi:hypothetical protein